MLTFKNILCPVDISSTFHQHIDYAVKLSDSNCKIHLLSVLELPYLVDPNGFNYYTEMAGKIKHQLEMDLNQLKTNLEQKYPGFIFVTKVVELMDPSDAILQEAKAIDADVVIVSSHGRRGLKRVLMGSIAETVMRNAECPVIILKM
jgi:universal stress protein A